jgi:hypothetical protein
MPVTQRIVPMRAFARAMLKSDEGFAERIRRFEDAFGKVDADTLAVMAQASYFCWFEVEYERDYVEVCRAIGSGKPTSLFLCRQVTPKRWAEMNSYIVGVQRWLGSDAPLPEAVDLSKIAQIIQWLGESNPQKEALAELFLCHLVPDLLRLSLAKLSGADDPDETAYVDFTRWYHGTDGTPVTLEGGQAVINELKRRVRQEMACSPDDAEELVAGILRKSQPACQHRFSRYQDIKIASIGALKWRGNVPPDTEVPRLAAAKWFEQASLEGWLQGVHPETDLAEKLYNALGTPTERKQAMVRDCLCGPPRGAWHWLQSNAEGEGLSAAALFKAS